MIIDISLPLTPTTPSYPGKRALERRIDAEIGEGSGANCSSFSMDCHLGTHVDAPLHFIRLGKSIDQVLLDRFIGPCVVVEVIGRREICPEDVEFLPSSVRVLFKTVGSALLRRGYADADEFAYLNKTAAELLVQKGVLLVGIDAYSIDALGSDDPAHHTFLPAGVPILECIDLTDVVPGNYHLAALPLRLMGSEASPVRAILIGD